MLHSRDGARFPPDVTLGIQAKEFHLSFISPQNFVLAYSQRAVMCFFTKEWLPSGHSNIKAWLVESCRDGCPSGRFSHLHKGTLELCQSDHRVPGHLPDKGTSPPIAQFGHAAISRKSLGCSKLILFKNDGDHCVLGDLQCCRTVLVAPDLCLDTILSQSYTDNSFELMAWFLLWHVNCGTLYRQMSAFPNHVQSIESPLDFNQVVETTQGRSMETGCTWAQFRVS